MNKVNFIEDFQNDPHLNFYLKQHRIALDIDECLADFSGAIIEKYKLTKEITNFYFTYNLSIFEEVFQDKDFWVNLKVVTKPEDIPFLPTCYISKRSIPIEWTQEWMYNNGFPCMPIIHVKEDKVEACKEWKIDYYIDDSISNFQSLNANGIKTFLFDRVHNQKYQVGNYRISEIKDIITKI